MTWQARCPRHAAFGARWPKRRTLAPSTKRSRPRSVSRSSSPATLAVSAASDCCPTFRRSSCSARCCASSPHLPPAEFITPTPRTTAPVRWISGSAVCRRSVPSRPRSPCGAGLYVRDERGRPLKADGGATAGLVGAPCPRAVRPDHCREEWTARPLVTAAPRAGHFYELSRQIVVIWSSRAVPRRRGRSL